MEVTVKKLIDYKEINIIVRNIFHLHVIQKLVDFAKNNCECYNIYCNCSSVAECNCECVNYKLIYNGEKSAIPLK